MITLDSEIWEWIEHNKYHSPDALRLSNHGDTLKMFAITQIDCRQRCGKKLDVTLARCPRFVFDSTIAAQQSTSDRLADYHARLIEKGARVLDMTGGLGIDALHCSFNAQKVVSVEIDKNRSDCAAHNFRTMGINNVETICDDSVRLLCRYPTDSFDVIFIDPARRGKNGERLYALNQCQPDVTTILDEMLRVAPTVIIKASPMLDVSQTLRELHNVDEIIALGTKSECKELAIICKRDLRAEVIYSAVTLMPSDTIRVGCNGESKKDIKIMSDIPAVGTIIYDPYPSVIKMKPFGLLCEMYSTIKAASDTHLFFSSSINKDFPGVGYEVIDAMELSKRALKLISGKYESLDITTSNFPIKAAELTSKIKVKPSGDTRLFAYRTDTGKKILIVARRV